MTICLSVTMLHILVLCPVLLASVLTLTIDSQLGTSVEDCFERVSIGEQLPTSDVYRNVSELTTKECEQICKQDKQCQSYDYGVGAKGNATCDLSKLDEKEIKEKNLLVRNPDYDVYVRRFQCEQSPPTPIQGQFDDPGESSGSSPQHRPVFRPDADEKRPLSDFPPLDLRPYETNGPKPYPPYGGTYRPERPNRPFNNYIENERPDDYENSKPDYDRPPSYGPHKPQDISYRPGPGRPHNQTHRPDPNDVLQFQDTYGRPRPPPLRPDPYYPSRPEDDIPDVYGQKPVKPITKPEHPQYVYIIRPNRKPHQDLRPQQDTGYGNKPKPEYPTKPDPYGPVGPPERPYRPRPIYEPTKPYDKPSYSYNEQYASNYGSSNQQDNSIYVEIYDPPRPYKPKPDRPYNGGGTFGYGTQSFDSHSSQNAYSQSSSHYGSASYDQNRPLYDPKPQKPVYGSTSSGYGLSDHTEGYGPQKPQTNKPIYSDQHSSTQGYGSQGGYGQVSYGESHSSSSQYGANQASYESHGYDQSHDRPIQGSYGGSSHDRPVQVGYGGPSHDRPIQGGYGGPSHDRPVQGGYDGPSHDRPIQGGYGGSSHDRPVQGGYDGPSYDRPVQGGYGGPSHDRPVQGGYGGPSHDRPIQGSYGSQTSQHAHDQGYGVHASQSSYGDSQYGHQGSVSNQYGSDHVGQNNQASYGQSSSRPPPGSVTDSFTSQYGGQSNQASYGSQSSSGYGNQGSFNHYGSQSGSSNQAAYGQSSNSYYGGQSNQASYGHLSDSQYGSQTSINQGYNSQSQGYGQSHGGSDYNSHNTGLNDQVTPNRPSYGSNHASSTQYGSQSSYGSNQASSSQYGSSTYGINQAQSDTGYKPKPGYGDQAPSSQYGSDSTYGGQGSQSDTGYNTKPGYSGQGSQSDTGYKPKPGYGGQGSQSDTGYKPKPGYGNNPTSQSDTGYNKPTYNDEGYKPSDNDSVGYDSDRPDYKPVYESEQDRPADVPSYIVGPNGDIATSRPVAVGDYGETPGYGRDPGNDVSYKACFRRVLAGRRALRSHVRKVLHCEHLEDCRRECAVEKRFHCESFNYRLDPSFRLKGLCELMTKPIEAFNLREDFVDDKDYDFYELDRNSLEPHCVDTLRGPGFLHSGYLSSKPSNPVPAYDRLSDRADWHDSHRGGYKYYDDRRNTYSNRRYDDQFFVPYQIGISRTNDDENWTQYGGAYGYNTYYKDRNDYHKSINHWRLPEIEKTYHGVKPYVGNTEFNYHSLGKSRSWDDQSYGYGSWKRGWSTRSNALDLGSVKPPKTFWVEAEGRSDDAASKDCSSRRRAGMSLGTGAIRRSLYARNVVECEAACFGETDFKCVSYSYRYSSSRGTDNCFLSERPYRGLEMSADSGSDVYAMPQDQGCETISRRPWIESECFWHVRSGAAVGGTAVRAALTVTGLGACEAECIRAHAFFCRGFSFRFDSPTIGDDLENCILTSTPPTSLDTGRGLRPTPGHELYARGNYGRGCEPALYDDVHYRDTQCYLQYDNAARLTGSSVRGQARVKDERACGAACTDAPFRCLSFSFKNNAPADKDNCLLSEIRLFDLQRGVDYEHSTDDWLFAFDVFNGQCWRKTHGKEYDIPTLEVPRPLSAPAADEIYPPSKPEPPSAPETYIASSGPSGPSYPSAPDTIPKPYPVPFKPYPPGPTGPVYKPIYLPESSPDSSGPSAPGYAPYRPSSPGYLDTKPPSGSGYKPAYPPSPQYDNPKPLYKPVYPELRPRPPYPGPIAPSSPGYKPGYPIEPSRPFQDPYPPRPSRPSTGDREDNEIIVSWRHYTVSGFPCRKGTSCAQNHVAGHWACEPEGGEIGSWDYCCAPTHRCGYSEGFQKPWCYVGPENDQWRPCSEKYYPYHQHNVPHPSQGIRDETRPRPSRPHRERPNYVEPDRLPGPYLSEADRKYWDELYKNGPQAYYDKFGNPLPGYTRVPTEERPYIKYRQTQPRPGSGTWVPVSAVQGDQPPGAGELGVPRYWPVAYLHKGPPPNMTYFRYNETAATTERHPAREPDTPQNDNPPPEFRSRTINGPNGNDLQSRNIDDDDSQIHDKPRHEKRRNRTCDDDEDDFRTTTNKPEITTTTTTTAKVDLKETTTEVIKEVNVNKVETTTESKPAENVPVHKEYDVIKGIDDKLDDFTTSIEIFDIEDAKQGGKLSDIKTVEAEERQIEAIGRLLASRRGGKIVLEKRSQKDLESKNIALDKDFVDFNFGNKFPTTERRGVIQKVSKDDIEKERFGNDRSLEVSETTFVRPPRVLSTTDNIRKAIVNGKVFYDATIRDQRELFSNSTRKPKNLRLEEARAPSVLANSNAKKKVVRARNINPIRRVRRVYRKRYNPDEVRKRLLEREKSKVNITDGIKS